MVPDRVTRRRVLGSLGTAGALGMAGCAGDGGDGVDSQTDTRGTTGAATSTSTTSEASSVHVEAAVSGLVARYDASSDGAGNATDADLREAIAGELANVSMRAVFVDRDAGVVEVRADADPGSLVAALGESGVEVSGDGVSAGVTNATREEIVSVVRDRLAAAGYGDASVTLDDADGRAHVVLDVPGATRAEVRDLLADRGRVRLVAAFPTSGESGGGRRRVTLATQGDFQRVGAVQAPNGARPPSVPVTLTSEAARDLTEMLVEHGFTDEGVSSCRWQDDADDPGYCIYTVVDGEVRYAAGMSPGLAEAMRTGEWVEDPKFLMQTADASAARALRRNLVAGSLPAPLKFEDGE